MADTIESLLALDDAALQKKLGLDLKIEKFKADLNAAKALPDAERKKVEERIAEAFGPKDYAVSEVGYAVESAQRRIALASKQRGKDKTDPGDMLASCGCCDVAP